MAFARLALLAIALALFIIVGIPLQAVALWRGWPLARWIPRFFHRTMCRILRVRVRTHGKPADAVPQLIVANHLSWVDILAISSLRATHFVAKREVRGWPIFGTFAVLQGSIFVDRGKAAELPKVNTELARRMLSGDRIVLFAEATTSDGRAMLRFRASHLGALQALLANAPEIDAVVVQPVAVHYRAHDGRTEVAWYGDMSLVPHVWAMLRGGPYDCDIGFGAAILFDRASRRRDAMLATQASVGAMLGAFSGNAADETVSGLAAPNEEAVPGDHVAFAASLVQ